MRDDRSGAARRPDEVGKRMRDATPPSSLQQHLEGRAKLIASVDRMRRPSRVRPALVAFSFAAAAVVLAFFVFRMRTGAAPAAPIAWHVEDGAVGAQGYVSIPST